MFETNDREREFRDPVEAALWILKPDEEGVGVTAAPDELSARRALDAILDERELVRAMKFERPKKRSRVTAVVAVAAAIVLTVVTVRFLSPSVERSMRPIHSGTAVENRVAGPAVENKQVAKTSYSYIPQSHFELLFGDVSLGDAAVTGGAEIPAAARIRTKNGKVALSLPTGIAVGLAENASARVLWDGQSTYGVSLINGTALFSVDPAQQRDGFYVETPAGTVRVTGTLFSVVVTPDNGVFIQLHKGRVLLERPDGKTVSVSGGMLTPLGDRKEIDAAVQSSVDRQLRTIRAVDDGTLFTELRALEDPGVVPEGESRVVRTVSARDSAGASLQSLMALARNRKAAGDWRGAAESYKTLIRQFKDTDEARTSLVSLGQIYLKHLGRPDEAVRLFDGYLKRSGPLAPEAFYAKSQALRAMGRASYETATLRRLLAGYPTGIYAESARKRLSELGAAPSL